MLANPNKNGVFNGPISKLIGIMEHTRVLTSFDTQANISVPRILPIFGFKNAMYYHGSVVHLEGMYDKVEASIMLPGIHNKYLFYPSIGWA